MDCLNVNKNVIKIIEILAERRTYLNEIYEKTGIKSKNNLLKNLNSLTNNKIIVREKNKSNTFYSLNFKNNVLIGLLSLINKTKFESLPFEVKKGIMEAIFTFKPRIAILFGSYAKKNYTKKSDVDLIFFDAIGKEGVNEISNKYSIKLNITFMQIGELQKDNEALNHIIKTGYPIVGGEYFYNEAKTI